MGADLIDKRNVDAGRIKMMCADCRNEYFGRFLSKEKVKDDFFFGFFLKLL
jgi:hypothetical protein